MSILKLLPLLVWLGANPLYAQEIDQLMSSFDWESIEADAVVLLSEYVQIDTSNPPGNESKAADFLATLLKAEGIKYDRYAATEGRDNLLARLPGSGEARAILLMSHSDVVGVNPESWKVPPFSGDTQNGFLWGRGTIDTKSLTILQFLAIREFHRAGIKLKRDLLLLAQADEEMGGAEGAGWLVENHPDVLDVQYVLDEGGTGITGLDVPVKTLAFIITAEKGVVWVRLTATGDAGHGSVPWKENAVQKIARAVYRLSDWEQPAALGTTSQSFLGALLRIRGEDVPEDSTALLNRVLELSPNNELSRRKLVGIASNTINPTQLKAGFKVNVVPGTAEASLDCRIVPGQSIEGFIASLKDRIDDSSVEVETLITAPSTESPIDSPLFRIIEMVVEKHVPDSVAVPFMALGGSDARFLRGKGITAYGFHPAMLDEEDFVAHQANERINLKKYNRALKIYFEILLRIGLQE